MSEQSLRSKIEAISQASISFPLLKLLGRVEALEIVVKNQDKAMRDLINEVASLNEVPKVKDAVREKEIEMEQHMLDTIADFNEQSNVEANMQQYELDFTGGGVKNARKE